MNIKLIGCLSTKFELERLQPAHQIDSEFLDFGLHAFPEKLHRTLQETIYRSQHYELIILSYSRCSNMILGLVSPAVPLLLPGTHDCISLLLGSDERRATLTARNPGAYYFSPGWLDYGRSPYEEYREYVVCYGEQEADRLINILYGYYNEAVFINTCDDTAAEGYRARVRKIAEFFGWKMSEVVGDLALLRGVINGIAIPSSIYVPPGRPITLADIPGGTA